MRRTSDKILEVKNMGERVYGYARISRKTQSIERQERNILKEYPQADIKKEAYTGTKIQGRKEFEKLIRTVKTGDTIVFDSVSRMARNSEEGTKLYFDLYEKGVNLVFLKERHIDTQAYAEALNSSGINIDTDDTAEGNLIADIVEALNKFMQAKVRADIKKAFDQAQKEVDDLHERTKEGIETARLNGKQIGQMPGKKLVTKKSIEMKEKIKLISKDFGGNMDDKMAMETLKLARNTFYKYKREIRQEIEME